MTDDKPRVHIPPCPCPPCVHYRATGRWQPGLTQAELNQRKRPAKAGR